MGKRQRVHLDTAVVISIIIGDGRVRGMLKALYDLARWDYEIVITQVAVGEALAVLMRMYPDPREIDDRIHKMIGIFRKYRISVEGCVVPVTDESHAIATRLHGMDGDITGNDLAITAQALADPDAVALVTTDSVLLDNDAIRECEADLRKGDRRNVRLRVLQRVV